MPGSTRGSSTRTPKRSNLIELSSVTVKKLKALIRKGSFYSIERGARVSHDMLDRAISGGRITPSAAAKLEAYVASLEVPAPSEVDRG